MYWAEHAEIVDATPLVQALMKTVPPYWTGEQVEQYARLTAPVAEQSAAWWQQFLQVQTDLWANWLAAFQQWQEAAPLPEIDNAIDKVIETTLRSFDETVANFSVAEVAKVAEPLAAWTSNEPDDLTAIAGIGPALARRLNDAGVNTYADIASWSEADIRHIEQSVLGGRFAGRIQRDDWVGQAQALSVRG